MFKMAFLVTLMTVAPALAFAQATTNQPAYGANWSSYSEGWSADQCKAVATSITSQLQILNAGPQGTSPSAQADFNQIKAVINDPRSLPAEQERYKANCGGRYVQ